MNNSIDQKESDVQEAGGVRFFDRILDWLMDVISLTEEEEDDAGIYL